MRRFPRWFSDVLFGATIVFLVVGGFCALLSLQGTGESRTHPIEAEPTETPTPTPSADGIEVVIIDGMPTAVLLSPTSTSTPTPTIAPTATSTPTIAPTNTPTIAPTCTETPKPTISAPKATNTPKPTKTPVKNDFTPYPTGYPHSRNVDDPATHTWKPYARYTLYLGKNTAQCRLQKKAHTASNGLRVVTDPKGVERYCVSLAPQWAGGQPIDIGRCVDIKMANGATLHCVLGDVKRHEHTQGEKGFYGSKGELIEFIADEEALPKNVHGDISNLGGAFAGEAVKITVLDLYIDGFGK